MPCNPCAVWGAECARVRPLLYLVSMASWRLCSLPPLCGPGGGGWEGLRAAAGQIVYIKMVIVQLNNVVRTFYTFVRAGGGRGRGPRADEIARASRRIAAEAERLNSNLISIITQPTAGRAHVHTPISISTHGNAEGLSCTVLCHFYLPSPLIPGRRHPSATPRRAGMHCAPA